MAHILEFRSGALRTEPESEGARSRGGGQIIIFPGVRIERHAEAEEVQAKPRKRGRPKRDRLELPE